MSSEKLPKYTAGETVTVNDKFGIVTEVHTEHYFWGDPNQIYYEYSVRFDDGSEHRYMETVLDKPGTPRSFCQCGAWSTAWSANQHSRWCMAYRPNGLS